MKRISGNPIRDDSSAIRTLLAKAHARELLANSDLVDEIIVFDFPWTAFSGKLAPGCTALDALRVSLPVGTVSGAPKIRAMQIIDDLEPTRRGPYGGAVGYLDFAGDMDTCIALRTIVWRNGTFDVQAGAGVVADSVPGAEFEETMSKAKAMLKAVQLAEEGF